MLWGRAAGRCEFKGCNTPLWKSQVTQEKVNRAQRAHIYAFSEDGPRGNRGISQARLNDFDNLMLVCHACHRKIDQDPSGSRYPALLLQQWKADHEHRIEVVTGIDPSKKSTVLLYGANIGKHNSPLNFMEAANALFPRLYPNKDHGINLGTRNSSLDERSAQFWAHEAENLRTQYEQRIRERAAAGEIDHLSVFALAPQPLLILLGSLIIDITNAEIFQRHREPQTWNWPERAPTVKYAVERPTQFTGPPALVLALSAPVTDDRIFSVLGSDAAIWKVTVAKPNTELIKSRKHLSAFRSIIRPLLDEMKKVHGQTTLLHIFPAAGVSIAVELGRSRMGKAHMPWTIYDQINNLGGFTHALNIAN